MQILVPLTYSEIEGTHPDEAVLAARLALLNREKTFFFLAMVNLLVSLYRKNQESFIKLQRILFKSLIDDELSRKIKVKFGSVNIGFRPLFFRKQLLTLMKRCLINCPEEGGFDLSSGENGRYELGTIALMMSDLIESEREREALEAKSNSAENQKRVREELVAQMMPNIELENPPDISPSIARNREYLEIFKRQATENKLLFANNKTLHQKFQELTGIDLDDYFKLISTTCLHYTEGIGNKELNKLINKPSDFNVGVKTMFANMSFPQDQVTKFFEQSALSLEEMTQAVVSHQGDLQLPEQYDFTIFRRYPMVYTRKERDIATCLDASFLVEKTANGIYFTIHNALKDQQALPEDDLRDNTTFMSHWGSVFEIYVNERLRDARFAMGLRDYYPSPYFTESPTKTNNPYQAFDAVLDYKSSLVVMEHKGKFARLSARCSGDRRKLLDELKTGDIIGKAAKQLARNLGYIFNNQLNGKRHTFFVEENDRRKTYEAKQISRVARIYPVIIHQDYFLRLTGVNNLAREIFETELAKHPIDPSLVRPLVLLTIEDLEFLIPYLKLKALPLVLDGYISASQPNNTLNTFNDFMIRFRKKHKLGRHPPQWIDRKRDELLDEIQNKFTSLTDQSEYHV